jgi:hypothetical protein
MLEVVGRDHRFCVTKLVSILGMLGKGTFFA